MSAVHQFDYQKESIVKQSKNRLFKRLVSCQPSFHLHYKSSFDRKNVEQYIYDKYKNVYHAELSQYMPFLLSMESNNKFNSIIGLRSAEKTDLFIEQYTSLPIEELIEKHCGIVSKRNEIIEIGNLAAVKRGSSQLLMIMVVAILYRSGYHWATFAATEDVQNITSKLGFITYRLCEAKSDQLKSSMEQWGNYYETRPYVIAGDLQATYKKLQNHRLYGIALRYFDDEITTLSQQFIQDLI